MKNLLLILLLSTTIVACGEDYRPIIGGNYVVIIDGEYEGCSGYVEDVVEEWAELSMDNCTTESGTNTIIIKTNLLTLNN